MCTSLTEIFISRYKGKYTLGRSSGLRIDNYTCETSENNEALIEQVKAQFTLTRELVSITN